MTSVVEHFPGMLKILDRYVVREVLPPFFLGLLVLTEARREARCIWMGSLASWKFRFEHRVGVIS